MPRPLSRSTISFGLVSIPVELFSATSSRSIHFNLLHAKDNSRIREKIVCIAENKEVDRSELVHGFPIRKGKYVSFTNEELKQVEAGAGREIEITEFVPIDKVDPVYFASAYLLGSGDAGAKAYHLLISAMQKTGRAALAKFVLRGKEHLVLIRPYENLLMLHTVHYADEIRSAGDVGKGAKGSVAASELKLAERLISDLSKDEFRPDKFEDTYREKILKMAKQKEAGHEVSAPAPEKRGKVIDLMAALKESLKTGGKSRTGENHGEEAEGANRSRARSAGRHRKNSAHRQGRRSAQS
jgi:DNA end-binding protein Ku